MRVLVLLVAIAVVQPSPADACGVGFPEPRASVVSGSDDKPTGRRPWIAVANVARTPRVVRVTETECYNSICKGTPIAVERAGDYLRPKAPLPAGARVQVTYEKDVLVDFKVETGAPRALPAWNGVTVASAIVDPGTACVDGGAEIALAIKPTKSSFDGTVLLVYTTKPDPRRPLANLKYVAAPNGAKFEIWRMTRTLPKRIWILLADHAGNVGQPIEVPIKATEPPAP